jgi:signal transduction histidine kinase
LTFRSENGTLNHMDGAYRKEGIPDVASIWRHRAEAAEQALEALKVSATWRTLALETANRVALDILAQRTGVEALRHIAHAAKTLACARYAALGVARLDGKGLVNFVTVGLTPEEEAAIGSRPQGIGILGLLLRQTEPLRIDSLSALPASIGFPPNHPPMKTFLGVPLRRGDTVVGSLYLTEKEGGGSFTEEDETAVQTLGAHAAVAIHHLHLIERQQRLVSGLIAAQEEERRAVAYDLHDGLTQYVMAAQAHLESFRRAQEAGKTDKASKEMRQGLTYLKDAVVESRRLVNGLRTLALDDLGLAGALELLLQEEKLRAGWQDATFLHNIAGRRFDKTQETAIYRVAQEAMTNARKHAEAQRIRVSLIFQTDRLTLEVEDDGKGFNPDELENRHDHVGLQSMAERVRLMDGVSQLNSALGHGTRLQAIFPISIAVDKEL